MTSVHMYAQPAQSNNGVGIDNQSKGIIQSPSKYDEIERVRQRMDNLRKHHNESTEIYNRTQPIINDQIHEETLKYLKNNQVNGTKAKNQKQRAPKKQRTSSNSNNSIVNNTVVQQNNVTVTSSANGFSPNSHQTPPLPQPDHIQQQITLYPTHMQQPQHLTQQTMQMQPKIIQNNHQMQPQTQPQSQQRFEYQPNNVNVYQQQPPPQPAMQNNIQYQQLHHVYPQQHQTRNRTHIHSQPVDLQNQYIVQPTQQHYTHQALDGAHYINHQQQPSYISSHTSIAPVHNDLDLTLQAGLECDVDSLIKHEMTVEGQLDFNHELLLKLDNHYTGYN